MALSSRHHKLLWGRVDVPDVGDIAGRYAREIAGARRVTMRDTAHIASLQRPDEFDRPVLHFLRAATDG